MAVNTIKVGAIQHCKDSLVLLTHSLKYVSIFKEFATDYSNASFEQCRVVLVCRLSTITNADMVLSRRGTMRKKTVWVIIISN